MAGAPIIFVPGFPASELLDASTGNTVFPPRWWQTILGSSKRKIVDRLIGNQPPLIAGPPILGIAGITKQAASLYDNLRPYGSIHPVGWDWRKGVDDVVVQGAIASALDAHGNATVVVHSTGGLVFRAFLESNPAYAAKIDQVLAFAVPWNGTFDAKAALEGKASMQVAHLIGFDGAEVQTIVKACKAAYDLLPQSPAPSKAIANAPPIVNICGWGAATYDSADLAKTKEGDGTVPFASATWIDTDREFVVPIGAYERNAIPQKHPHIWDSPPVIALLDQLLGTAQPKPFIAAGVDSDDDFPSVDPVRVRIAALDANGDALPGAKVTMAGQSWPIDRRLEVNLPRAALPNNANGYARVSVAVDWNGGSHHTAVAVRAR